jgi:diguanylate cyclase (GGDEF)-like protein
MAWVSMRLILALLAALAGVVIFLFTDSFTESYYKETRRVGKELMSLENTLNEIRADLLKNGILLYFNYDILNEELKRACETIERLYSDSSLKKGSYLQAYWKLLDFRKDFDKFVSKVERFVRLNGSIKNSALYIQTLHLRAFELFDSSKEEEKKVLLLLSRISVTVSIAKNAQDPDFLHDMSGYAEELQRYAKRYKNEKRALLRTISRHVRLFVELFPEYIEIFQDLTDDKLKQKSSEILKSYQDGSRRELSTIEYTVQIMLLLYLLSLSIVIYFIFRVEKENRRLDKLHTVLMKSLMTDSLTGLENRVAFAQEKDGLKSPVLILVNIDRFQHINDFYGTDMGDKVLVRFAGVLSRFIARSSESMSLYRLGGDDFGILYDASSTSSSIDEIVQRTYLFVENEEIKIDDITFDISISIGASDDRERLFETADIALKHVKRSERERTAIYNESLDNRGEIERNLATIRELKKALLEKRKDTVTPYFQPLMDMHKGEITHFEALARIVLNSKVMKPENFLEATKMAKLSGMVTYEMLKRTLEVAHGCSYTFSVNISAGDMYNQKDRNLILGLLEDAGESASKITLEILESEEIYDYAIVKDFIKEVRKFGCKVAIDDFGSGYSNFENILALDIDIIKIDGTLIHRIDHDTHAQLIVRTIVTFAKEAGFKTVAEYVHSESVLQMVRAIGIDYAQGYHIGKPLGEIECIKENLRIGRL